MRFTNGCSHSGFGQVLLAGVEATLTSKTAGRYELAVAFGSLKLPAGGLSADGVACEVAVDLVASQSVSWAR